MNKLLVILMLITFPILVFSQGVEINMKQYTLEDSEYSLRVKAYYNLEQYEQYDYSILISSEKIKSGFVVIVNMGLPEYFSNYIEKELTPSIVIDKYLSENPIVFTLNSDYLIIETNIQDLIDAGIEEWSKYIEKNRDLYSLKYYDEMIQTILYYKISSVISPLTGNILQGAKFSIGKNNYVSEEGAIRTVGSVDIANIIEGYALLGEFKIYHLSSKAYNDENPNSLMTIDGIISRENVIQKISVKLIPIIENIENYQIATFIRK